MKLLAKAGAKGIHFIKKHPGLAAGVLIGTMLPDPVQSGVKGLGLGAGAYALGRTAQSQNTHPIQ